MFLALSFNVVISPLTRVKWGYGGAKDRIDRILPSTCQNVKKKKTCIYIYIHPHTSEGLAQIQDYDFIQEREH